ncbi:hypothetical protein [Proteus mirabilis]|uniref:hypothetical protein n=1 Tax=Proteus mirabilis TaxID=584 RepID=UPI000A84D229|nr:hypothetical protein [Proteus mirabilis]MDC5878251.1 hypothetical protein [Proteus mirabilis]HCR3455854.1 hypothetical protein [Proteus mirabilis]
MRTAHPYVDSSDECHFVKPLHFDAEEDTFPNFVLMSVIYKEFEPLAGLSLAVRELEK